MKQKRYLLYSLVLVTLLLAASCRDNSSLSSMLSTILQKGASYALVAFSLNLLNGFTGLFSLGQAGFMLLGAYTYAILTIPVEARSSVYQYFNGGLVLF